jgi:uncharacterized membrane protein
MICNSTLAQIAEGVGIKGLTDDSKSSANALEIEAARIFYAEGFAGVRAWAFVLFEKHLDITEEVRRILNPTPADKLVRQARGALKNAITARGGKITGNMVEQAAREIAAQLNYSGAA